MLDNQSAAPFCFVKKRLGTRKSVKSIREMIKPVVRRLITPMHYFFANPLAYLRRRCCPLRGIYRQNFKMTLLQWLRYHQKDIVFERCHWMGAQALKNPLDAWIYQEIIAEVQPDIIIEIGSYAGGSTLYLAHLLDILGKGRVLSIDLDRSRFSVSHERIILITGNSWSETVLSRVREICRGKSVLVIHDGDHEKSAVLKDLRAYAEFVSVNSYFIVEDGIVDLFRPGGAFGNYNEGPLAAVEQFLQEYPQFVVDMERERYILTYNPNGYLKRVR